MLYMQQFKYNIKHIYGINNAADALSRLPVGNLKYLLSRLKNTARAVVADSIPATLLPR